MRDDTAAKSEVSRVAQGGITAFIVYGAGIALTYFSQLIVARIVGIESYGFYAYVFAWITILVYFSSLGFDIGLLRFIPAYEAVRAWPLVRGVIQYSHRWVAITSIAVALAGAFVAWRSAIPAELKTTFFAGFALLPILALLRLRCSVVRAFGGVTLAIAPDRIVREGVLITVLGITSLLFGWTIDAPLAMLALIVGCSVGLGCANLAERKLRPPNLEVVTGTYDAPAWRRAALPLMIIGAAEALMNRAGVIMLGWFADTKDAGIFSLAFSISLAVTLPRIAVNTLFAPTVSSLHAHDEKASIQMLVNRATAWTLCAGGAIALILFIIAEPLLSWFGPGYEVGVPALRILLVAQVIAASAGSQVYVMTMTGHERTAALLLVFGTITNLVATALLIRSHGMTGAAVATLLTLVAWNTAMAYVIWRRLDLMPGVLGLSGPSQAGKASSIKTSLS